MKIENIVVGQLETNCYILEKDNRVLVIDPGADLNKIKKVINHREVIGIVITHYHIDHVGALEALRESYDVPVYDYSNLTEGQNKIGPFTFEMIKVPGHKEDLISIYFQEEKVMFVGDFIFKGSVGRTDLEGGDPVEMQKSITKIKKYPREIILYPGHGPSTILGDEIKYNLYF